MSNRDVRRITEKANRKNEKEVRREVRSVIRTLKADIKRAAKKGVADFRCKIGNAEIYNRAKMYFINKGFRCWEYTMADCKYLAIEW